MLCFPFMLPGVLHALTQLKQKNKKLKILAAVDMANSNASNPTPVSKDTVVVALETFCSQHGLDGVALGQTLVWKLADRGVCDVEVGVEP